MVKCGVEVTNLSNCGKWILVLLSYTVFLVKNEEEWMLDGFKQKCSKDIAFEQTVSKILCAYGFFSASFSLCVLWAVFLLGSMFM